ncbi:alkylated DNA repair protein alkB homolog 8-like [Hydra vulgaris]|uniref:tRNA (carboxymethyluridine(34)-5-O)-methyltransferase n=1 Tax=Hydra vulgaris TaxID=6087 RepID=A0ABM4DP52_HYDVU
MESNNNKKKAEKTTKKLKKKTVRLLKDFEDTKISLQPTQHLFVGNAGLLNGVARESLLHLFSKYGSVKDLTMVPQKSFAFISYQSVESSVLAVAALTGYNIISEDNIPSAPLYFSYLYQKINLPYIQTQLYPNESRQQINIIGLDIKVNYIDEVYEKELYDFFYCKEDDGSLMKNRTVKHFGYEFIYGSNNIDRSKPLAQKIPSVCDSLLKKMLLDNIIDFMPDQLTVNQYRPGQGIPSHIDTHSAFEDGIVSLSLNSQVTMEFKKSSNELVPVILYPRSLLVMKGESRYQWTHGITPRKFDIVYTTSQLNSTAEQDFFTEEHLTLRERRIRISLTFRKIRFSPCICNFTEKCDSQIVNQANVLLPITLIEAMHLEDKHVVKVYEQIAMHFSDTRHSPWPRVKHFLNNLKNGSLVADVGCGNGKYLGINPDLVSVGSDRSINLISICKERNFEVCISDCLTLPYRSNVFDAVICIAVIHHLSTQTRRLQAVEELIRIVNTNGLILIYVWAIEQDNEKNLNLYENCKTESPNMCNSSNDSTDKICCGKFSFDTITTESRRKIEISEGRNTFQQQDLLIPWHLKEEKCKTEEIFHRFYHVFVKGELEELCSHNPYVKIEDVYFDCGNWCIVMRKKN